MATSIRTAFAGSFASGVVMPPLRPSREREPDDFGEAADPDDAFPPAFPLLRQSSGASVRNDRADHLDG